MCSPETSSIIVIIVMAVSGCCGVFVWISLLLGCIHVIYKCYKSPKQEQRRQRNTRSHDGYDDRATSNAHQNSPPVPATPVLQPMTVLVPVYNQATLMTHPIQPMAGGNWVPTVDEANSTLYHNRTMQQNISSRSLQRSNPLYEDDQNYSYSTSSHAYGNGAHIHHYSSTSNHGGQVIVSDQQLNSINESNIDDTDSPPPDYDSLT